MVRKDEGQDALTMVNQDMLLTMRSREDKKQRLATHRICMYVSHGEVECIWNVETSQNQIR